MKSEPRLLLHHGRFLKSAMRAKLVMQGEMLSAFRTAGVTDPAQAGAVALGVDARSA